MEYRLRKGFARKGHPPKGVDERLLVQEQIQKILNAVRAGGHYNSIRDHAAIYLGFSFGLRVGEAVLLERSNFAKMDAGTIEVHRLKRIAKISITCGMCKRKMRVAAARAGKDFLCRCATLVKVPDMKDISLDPPLIVVPFCELPVRQYVKKYMAEHMRPEQRWFFEGRAGMHLTPCMLEIIFSTYAHAAGLPKEYSWHALRHGRGVAIYDRFTDLLKVKEGLGQKSLTAAEIYIHMSPKARQATEKELGKGALDNS